MRAIRNILFALLPLLLASCQFFKPAAEGEQPLVEVEGQCLYPDDMRQIIPEGTPTADSIALAEAYIRKWATNVLLYENAKRNVYNEAEIEEMVAEYRKSLTIHYYEQQLVQQRLDEISDDAVTEFYQQHIEKFPLTSTLMRGVFIKVPMSAPDMAKLKKYLHKLDNESIQKIEEYCVKHAASYDYFVDNWVVADDVLKQMPRTGLSASVLVQGDSFYEVCDSTYCYLLNITDKKLEGTTAPIEYVHDKIVSLMTNQRKLDYMQQFEYSLYDDAVNEGKIKFYDQQKNAIHILEDVVK